VGTGEAGAGPSSQSLIADYFPPERRATALGIYSMGIFIGAGAGLAIGGWLASIYGWRGAFVAVAIPGVIFALIFRLTVREPQRGGADRFTSAAADLDAVPTFLESVHLFVRTPGVLPAAIGLGFSVFTVQSLLNWLPAFLSRYHDLAPAAAGGRIGPIIAVAGTLGVLSGGLLADRLSKRDRRNSPRMMAVASLLVVPAGILTLLADNGAILYGALAVCFFLTAMVSGPTFALIQNQAPVRTRALSAALVGLIAVILGNAMGPFLTGLMSDVYAGSGVADSLRWSLVTSVSLSLFGSISYSISAKQLIETSR
jgi:MFS family permease